MNGAWAAAAMCDTLEKFGPDAPTLCEGWTTLDLAAHLVAREARADAAIGLVVPALAGHLQKVMDQYKAKGYDISSLLDAGSGP